MRFFLTLSLLLVIVACGDDDVSVDASADAAGFDDSGLLDSAIIDGGPDSNTVRDLGIADASEADGSAPDMRVVMDAGPDVALPDAGSADAGTDAPLLDAGTDMSVFDAGAEACNDLVFGEPAVAFRRVDSLPTMTGGDIVEGIYDLVDVQVTSGISGTFQATWSFGPTTIAMINQITLPSTRPVVPRVDEYTVVGNTLNRRRVCGGSETFEGRFTIRRNDGTTEMDLRSGGLLLTFRSR